MKFQEKNSIIGSLCFVFFVLRCSFFTFDYLPMLILYIYFIFKTTHNLLCNSLGPFDLTFLCFAISKCCQSCFRCFLKVPDDLKKEQATYLKCPEYSDNVAKILKRLSPGDRVDLCQAVGIAVPKVYPLLWTKERHKLGEFEDFISLELRNSTLRCLMKEKSNLMLPKRIVISYKGYTAYFGPTLTKISESFIKKKGFELSELEHHYVISHKLVISYNVASGNISERHVINESERLDASDSHVGMQVDGSFDEQLGDASLDDFQPNLNSTAMVTGDNRDQDYEENEAQSNIRFEEQSEIVNSSMAPEVSITTQKSFTSRDQTNCTENTQMTLPKQKIKYTNIYQNPLQLSNVDFCILIHCTKLQFIEFVNALRPYYHQITSESHLSLTSRAFLFRMKIATFESDARLGTFFSVDKKTANNIYWDILEITYLYNLQVPDFLDSNLNVDELFDQMAELQDTFFTKLVEPIQDPKGKYLNRIFNPLLYNYFFSQKNYCLLQGNIFPIRFILTTKSFTVKVYKEYCDGVLIN